MRSPARVEAALRVLSPVLREQVGSGIRFYHESFGRFVRERVAEHPDEVNALLQTISDWLIKRGLFDDQRAFRWLIPTLAEQNRHADLVALIGDDFVETAIANAFPVRGICANLARASESAAILSDWPGLVRLIQMTGAAHTFDFDRFETLVDFTDVQASFVDPQQIADRLNDGDRLVVTGRHAVLRCAALDAAGAVAPWAECLAAYERERKGDNVHRGSADDQRVGLAALRGRLRLVPTGLSPSDLKWKRIAKYVDRLAAPVPAVVDLIGDVVGLEYVPALAQYSSNGELFLLDLAERVPDYRDVALKRIRSERRVAGSAHRALALGLDPTEMWPRTSKLRKRLLEATRKVIVGPSSSRPGELEDWLDLCAHAARLDPLGLASAEAIVQGEGWYRCWLEFVIELVRAESAEKQQSAALALDSLRILEKETNPFRGKPRASDLYSAHETIADTITRALRLVSPEQWGEALDILGRVSHTTTTIAMGFAGGPLLADVLASIAEDVSPATARGTLRTHLHAQIADAGADVMYPEVAGYHLRLARLELQDGATEKAAEHWRLGVSHLTAYGSHKDATIYELTEPLEDLIEFDRPAVRHALQRLQPITLAVEHHTDGRGTSRVHSDWWKGVARADPTWLIDMALPELADHVNSSHWALQGAVEEVWAFHRGNADPRISAAVRVAVEIALTDTDPPDLARYLEAGLLDEAGGEDLLRAVMSRFDERPTSSTYTNGQEILDATEALLARAMDAVEATSLPRAYRVRPARVVPKESDRWGLSSTRSSAPLIVDWSSVKTFAPGLPGVYEAIQTIRQRGRDSEGSGLGPDEYQNVIGYRLVELDESGRVGDAEQALFELANALPHGERPILLTSLSDGFHRLGRTVLAATAGVLAWTRMRQRGGWGTFGAKENLEYLARAFGADVSVAREVLGREVARITVTSDSSGPSQALIHAAGAGALPWAGGPADAAIRCWTAACDVVDRRTPRFPASDISEYPYVPTVAAELPQAEVDRCVASVALARVCAPSREAKRRALIAIGDLLEFRPGSIIRDLDHFVGRLSDPVTQHGVLSTALAIPGVADELQGALSDLARSELLSIRSLARLHVHDLPDLPVSSPIDELLAALRDTAWDPSPDPGAEELVEEFLARRIARSARLMPELESAILARLSDEDAASNWKKRVSSQLESLASRARFRWPDAILAYEEAAEREVQTLAGAARLARIVVGDPIAKPAEWEAALGARLEPGARIALDIEGTRIPRPDIPAAPHPDDPEWVADTQGSSKTIRAEGDLADFEIDGWACIGLIERREYGGKHSDAKGSISMTIAGVYAGEPAPGDIPLGGGTLRWWGESGRDEPLSPHPFPLVAMSKDASRPTGLGAPNFLLTPTPALRGALDLRPTDRAFSMADDTGEVVARLLVWRAEYEASDYELTYPRVQGQALVIRPDRMGKVAKSLPFKLQSALVRTLFAASDPDHDE